MYPVLAFQPGEHAALRLAVQSALYGSGDQPLALVASAIGVRELLPHVTSRVQLAALRRVVQHWMATSASVAERSTNQDAVIAATANVRTHEAELAAIADLERRLTTAAAAITVACIDETGHQDVG